MCGFAHVCAAEVLLQCWNACVTFVSGLPWMVPALVQLVQVWVLLTQSGNVCFKHNGALCMSVARQRFQNVCACVCVSVRTLRYSHHTFTVAYSMCSLNFFSLLLSHTTTYSSTCPHAPLLFFALSLCLCVCIAVCKRLFGRLTTSYLFFETSHLSLVLLLYLSLCFLQLIFQWIDFAKKKKKKKKRELLLILFKKYNAGSSWLIK